MPVSSVHCFANHRGGVGKTTLTYQISAAFAIAHPQSNVLVIDATNSGDVSQMLLGGLFETRGRETLKTLVPIANTTQLFLRALAASTTNILQTALKADSDDKTQAFRKAIESMPTSKAKLAIMPSDTEVGSVLTNTGVELQEYAIPLKHINCRLPENMFLCPSGLDVEQAIAFSDFQRRNIISVLNNACIQAEGNWKIFVDTDASPPHGHSDVYTMIALGISDFLCLPLHADMTDWYRVRALLLDLHMLHMTGESHAKVQLVLWNGLTVKFNKGCSVSSTPTNSKCTFTPTKAEQDVIQSLNSLVYQEAEKYPQQFLHYKGPKTSMEEFYAQCSVCVRNFSVVGVASKDIGVPIASIKPGVFHGFHMTYLLNENTIQRCRENLEEIVKVIEASEAVKAMTPRIKGPASKRIKRSPKTSDGSMYRSYNTRYKYPLRDRTKKSPFSDGFLELSSSSTIHT